MTRRASALAVLAVLASCTGCMQHKTTDPAFAIATFENLGGTVEPVDPTPSRPVTRISLRGTPVSDAQLQYLDAFPGLRLLSLANTEVTDAGLEHLKRLRNLKRLSLSGTLVTMDGMRDLRASNPHIQIQR